MSMSLARGLAPSRSMKLLQVRPCEVAYGAIWPEIPWVDVGGRNQAVCALRLSCFSCNLHSARCCQRCSGRVKTLPRLTR
jgi:hypothetical protein